LNLDFRRVLVQTLPRVPIGCVCKPAFTGKKSGTFEPLRTRTDLSPVEISQLERETCNQKVLSCVNLNLYENFT
jgi:hypothetical protein